MSAQAAGSPHSTGEVGPHRSAPPTSAELILPTGQEWPLTSDVLTIGRRIGNHILIDDPMVSGEHAKVVRVGDRFVLLDLRSSNGTFVNGQRIQDMYVLRDGDRIEVAGRAFLFRAPPSDDEESAPTASDPAALPAAGVAEFARLLFQEVLLSGRELTIGRAPENDLVLNDSRVSSEHAKIVRLGDDYWLIDLRSSNGTFVNEQRIRDVHLLRDGDVLAVGATTLTFARRMLQVDEEEPEPAHVGSFVFADLTGKRWLRVRIVAAVAAVLLVIVLILFGRFILQ